MHSFGFRQNHLLPFPTYAEIMNIDPFELYALSRVGCCQDCYKQGCGVSWNEYDWQVKDRPSRMSLAQRLFQAETMIGNYLKTPVGPTYIKGEMHTVNFHNRHKHYGQYNRFSHVQHDPGIVIQTRYRNVLATGTQVLRPIGENLDQERTFIDRRGWGFTDDIVYCMGSAAEPLLVSTLEDQEIDNLCNLRIYQEDYGPINDGCEPQIDADGNICYLDNWTSSEAEFYHGHRLRPFHATYDGEKLCIQINKAHNVKLDLYSRVPQNAKGNIADIKFCEEDSYPERLKVYNVSYEKPDGTAYLRKQPCYCSTGCDACQLREVEICLEPIDPISGEFRVVPIVNTAEDGEPCCWEATSWGQCCYDLYGDYNACGCDIPVVVCINYMASACGNWGDCCFPDTVCPDLAPSVAYLASSMFVSVCNCGCFDDLFQHYSMDMMMALSEKRSGSILYASEPGFYVFGSTRGAYEAYNQIRHRHRIQPIGDYMIG